MADEEKKEEQPIIVKKIVKGGGHHGGAWKVAYADFVTAMMAFFLLLWLLNVTTDEQKNAISNYFDPTAVKVSDFTSGAGGVLGGLSMSAEGSMATNKQPIVSNEKKAASVNNQSARKSPDGTEETTDTPTKEKKQVITKAVQAVDTAKEALRKAEEAMFEETKKIIEEAILKDDDLKELAKNLLIDITPEGLRIQVVDEKGRPMFASGSAKMLDLPRRLLEKVTNLIAPLANDISIRGHTDSIPYGPGANYTNWELSADRANTARRVIQESGMDTARIKNVIGRADTEHLLPEDPNNARNRRISIVLLKEEIAKPEAFNKKAEDMAGDIIADEAADSDADAEAGPGNAGPPSPVQVPIGTFRRTPGAVEFP